MTDQKDRCPDCKGRGVKFNIAERSEWTCHTCTGTGEKKLDEVKLPPVGRGGEANDEPVVDSSRETIHEITSLLARRIVGETAKKNPSGVVMVGFNEEADKKLLVLIELLREEIEGLNQLFDMRHEADIRATKRWRESHPGKELILPDHADLVYFLMDEIEKAKKQGIRMAIDNLKMHYCIVATEARIKEIEADV